MANQMDVLQVDDLAASVKFKIQPGHTVILRIQDGQGG
jgi:uncharacterized protein YacL